MSFWVRTLYVMLVTIGNAAQAILYFRVGKQELFQLATGQFSGPFSFIIGWVDAAWALEIVILQVAVMAYWVYGGVQQEQARARVVRP